MAVVKVAKRDVTTVRSLVVAVVTLLIRGSNRCGEFGALESTFIETKIILFYSIAKQFIPTYINHTRPLIPDGIHLF